MEIDMPGNLVRTRSGHTSTALDLYKRPNNNLLSSVSASLQPPKPRYISSTITKKQ